jgi:hypothetical protein
MSIGDAPTLGAFGFQYGGFFVTKIENQKVFQGVVFGWSKRFVIAKSGSVDIIIDPTAIPEEKDFIILPIKFQGALAGPINVDIYFGATADNDGTEWEGINRDALSLNTPATIVRFEPTVSDPGTKIPLEYQIPSNGTAAVTSVAGAVEEDFISRLRTDGKYLIRLTNLDTVNAAQCQFSTDIFEVEEGRG